MPLFVALFQRHGRSRSPTSLLREATRRRDARDPSLLGSRSGGWFGGVHCTPIPNTPHHTHSLAFVDVWLYKMFDIDLLIY